MRVVPRSRPESVSRPGRIEPLFFAFGRLKTQNIPRMVSPSKHVEQRQPVALATAKPIYPRLRKRDLGVVHKKILDDQTGGLAQPQCALPHQIDWICNLLIPEPDTGTARSFHPLMHPK